MTERKRTLLWLLPALLLFAAGFTVAALYDLSINTAVHTPGSYFAILMEAFGWYPAFLPTLWAALLFATQRPAALRQAWQPVAGGVVALGGFAALYLTSRNYLAKRGMLPAGSMAGWLWLGAGVLFALLLVFLAFRLTAPNRQKMLFFGAFSTLYLVANQLVTNLLKAVWQRPRFDDMLGDGRLHEFSGWLQPFSAGGSSFPSGHTANAAGIFVLIILCDLYPALAKHRRLITALCWAYIAAMAVARIMIGRHFLSDTLAAAGLMALLFWGMHASGTYKKSLGRALSGAAGEG